MFTPLYQNSDRKRSVVCLLSTGEWVTVALSCEDLSSLFTDWGKISDMSLVVKRRVGHYTACLLTIFLLCQQNDEGRSMICLCCQQASGSPQCFLSFLRQQRDGRRIAVNRRVDHCGQSFFAVNKVIKENQWFACCQQEDESPCFVQMLTSFRVGQTINRGSVPCYQHVNGSL